MLNAETKRSDVGLWYQAMLRLRSIQVLVSELEWFREHD